MSMKTDNPFQNANTVWLYDYRRNTVIEKQSDGSSITHISPQSGKYFLSAHLLNKIISRK